MWVLHTTHKLNRVKHVREGSKAVRWVSTVDAILSRVAEVGLTREQAMRVSQEKEFHKGISLRKEIHWYIPGTVTRPWWLEEIDQRGRLVGYKVREKGARNIRSISLFLKLSYFSDWNEKPFAFFELSDMSSSVLLKDHSTFQVSVTV